MFKIGVKRLAWIAVKWPGLAEDGSQVENEVELKVELVERSALKAQIDAENMNDAEAGLDFGRRITSDWKGVGDAAGNLLQFSPDSFALLQEAPGFAAAFGRAYIQAWNGQSEMRVKNSEPSPGAGPPDEAKAAQSAS